MFSFPFELTDFIHKEYKKNEVIKTEGEECTDVGFILSGKINISNINWIDKEFNFQHLYEGDIFGEMLIFSENNHYPGTIYSTTNSTVLFISKEKFLYKISNDLSFRNYYLNYTSLKFIQMQTRIKILTQTSIEEKFLYYLKVQAQKSNSNKIKIKSITKLAEYLNVTRPSLSRTISNMIKENKITVNNKFYSLKKP